MESFLGTRPCAQVKPGDLLGLYFYSLTTRPIDFYFFTVNVPPLISLNNLPSLDIGSVVQVQAFQQPYFTTAAAYYTNGNKHVSVLFLPCNILVSLGL
jgi:hypothetical protein